MLSSFSQFAVQMLLTAFHCRSSVPVMLKTYWRKLLGGVSAVSCTVFILLVSSMIPSKNFFSKNNDRSYMICVVIPH
jgi:hypothetical protein